MAAAKGSPELLAQISTSLWEAWRLSRINLKRNQHQISDKQGKQIHRLCLKSWARLNRIKRLEWKRNWGGKKANLISHYRNMDLQDWRWKMWCFRWLMHDCDSESSHHSFSAAASRDVKLIQVHRESLVCKPHRKAMEYSYLNQVGVIRVADKVMYSLYIDILLILPCVREGVSCFWWKIWRVRWITLLENEVFGFLSINIAAIYLVVRRQSSVYLTATFTYPYQKKVEF